METIWKGKQTNKQTSGGGRCRGADAGGSVELCNMQSPICNVSEYAEELRRCIRDALEKHGVRYTGSYSDTTPGPSRNPQANPPHHRRNPCTMPTSTHHPQQAINSIPSMNEPHITVTLTIPDAIASHIIGCAGMGLYQIHDFSHAKVTVSSH